MQFYKTSFLKPGVDVSQSAACTCQHVPGAIMEGYYFLMINGLKKDESFLWGNDFMYVISIE